MSSELTPEEARVLGALVEKHNTTPDYYPLTLNSLVTACNQKSNREPVTNLTENDVLASIDLLRDKQLAWMVTGMDSRVPKYEHNFDKKLDLTLQETAVMCVLLLRGAQTPGELRSRCARIYPFETMDEVHITLEDLIGKEEALVTRLPVQPGRKEARYMHLMCGEPDLEAEAYAAPAPAAAAAAPNNEELEALREEIKTLRTEFDQLNAEFAAFKSQFE